MNEVASCLVEFNNLLDGDSYQWEGVELAKNKPNAYLIAVVLDQGMKAEKVWAIPNKIGWHWNIEFLNSLSIAEIENDLKLMGVRYWKNMSRYVRCSIDILRDKYQGNAANIWNDKPSCEAMYNRFLEFPGIGQKKASMAVNILLRECGVETKDTIVDVSYDKHIRQVFLRSGLADKDDREHIINAARKEYPEYPGILDKPAWFIGKEFCFNENPMCSKCPLGEVCGRRINIRIK